MSSRGQRFRFGIASVAMVVAGSVVLVSAFGGIASLYAAPSPPAQAQVEAGVLAEMQRTGKSTYWVVMREVADLKPARGLSHRARGKFVFDQLRGVAHRSQAGLQSLLHRRGATFTSFWAANVLQVTSDAATLNAVAARPEVAKIVAERVYHIPEPQIAVQEPTVQGVEWNIANIRAPDVWSSFDTRGEGIVVGTIDTGVQFDHPALLRQYRGNLGGGAFNHSYNWFDPSEVCGTPSVTPCDNIKHGTHTMGTILGDDGGGNRIGVAPNARWITAKGCETTSCSTAALVAAGQWMLAPTDLAGLNPRPDLRPNIVSNSWSGASGNSFYQQIVQAWVAAGIFPVFANGNSGPACESVGSPGDYPESYGVGAYDASNVIASFSSRGASSFGVVKPNISAPGVDVRSSVPGNGYAVLSGTSMATPHVAGTVALMWSAAPTLLADVSATRQILDQTAIDTADHSCHGKNDNNNVYGEGRLDAFVAVEQSPRGSAGTLEGTVTDADSGQPLAEMLVSVMGSSTRTTTTDAAGHYTLVVAPGTYTISVSAFGYLTKTVTGIDIVEGEVTQQNVELSAAPSYSLSGVLRDANANPMANATVTILGTPIAATTSDATGAYAFGSVPAGTYDVKAKAGRCFEPQLQSVVLERDATLNFTLPLRTDAFGYSCSLLSPAWVEGSTVLPLTGDNDSTSVSLPFPFAFYGVPYTEAYVNTNGYLTFLPPTLTWVYFFSANLPRIYEPNAAIYVFWDDLYLDEDSSVRTDVLGEAPNRGFVIEWRNVAFLRDLNQRIDAEAVLYEGGEIVMQYRNIDPLSTDEEGGSATLGIENESGTVASQYSFSEPTVSDGLAIRYAATPFTGIMGHIADANDTLAVQGATVEVLETGDSVQADTNGYYQMPLELGTYTLSVTAPNYDTQTAAVVLDNQNPAATQDFVLNTALATVIPASLSFSMGAGESMTQALTISNTGGLDLDWSIEESNGDVPWLSETPIQGSLTPGNGQSVQVTADATGLADGSYAAALLVQSDAGRSPTVYVSVTLTVQQAKKGKGGGKGNHGH